MEKPTSTASLPGFGVFQIPADETAAVASAIEAGYRHIDTAQSYFNEQAVGEGIRAASIDRGELFVNAKVWINNYGEGTTLDSVKASLERLGLDYVDQVLLHQPFSDVFGAWRDLEKAKEQGLVRKIGVSNFSTYRLHDLGSFSEVYPEVNQIEINPFHQRTEDVAWYLEHGVTPLTKSVHVERMRQNLDATDFTLTDEDLAAIATLDQGGSQFFEHQSTDAVDLMVSFVKQRRQQS